MREIKFRLIYNGKIVGYERHEYNASNNHITIFHNGDNIAAVEGAEVHHNKKDQFTGLKDKNGKGKEAFEGDIVICSTSKSQHYKGIIKWESPCFYLSCFWHKQDPVGNICEGYELDYSVGGHKIKLTAESINKIIGSIHENPELLAEKK